MSLLLPFGNSDGEPLAADSRNSSIDIDDVFEPMRTNSEESETARADVCATDAPPASSETRQTKRADDSTHSSAFGATSPAAPSTASEQIGLSTSFHPALIQALSQLEQVDKVLESLGILWANTEVIFEVLLQKSDHVERFVDYASKPRAVARFHERMSEYKQFWGRVHQLCARYLASVPMHHAAYGFLSNMSEEPPEAPPV